MERMCSLCGNPIPNGRRKDAKYCSDRCRTNSHYARHGDRIRAEWRKKHPEREESRVCADCGRDFIRGRSDQIYCSAACNQKAYEKRHAQKIAEKRTKMKELRRGLRLARLAMPRVIELCHFEGCDVTNEDDPAFKGGKCNVHYLRDYRGEQRAQTTGPRTCAAEGCEADISRGRLNQRFCSGVCQQKAWVATTDQEQLRAKGSKRAGDRRARMFNNPGYEYFSYQEWLELLIACSFRCTYCHKYPPERLQMDHIVALARGGPHRLDNVTPARGPCNRSKHDSSIEEWFYREELKALKKAGLARRRRSVVRS